MLMLNGKLSSITKQETHHTKKVEKLWEMEWGNKIEWLHVTNKSRGNVGPMSHRDL